MEETRSSLKDSKSRSAVLDALMKMKAKGAIKGIHGRLGDLGAIDAQYDVAISTACSALDNIVVETTEAGQACVQYLRENNLGRATFIIMQKIDYLKDQFKPIQVPDKAKRLFDLVRLQDDKFKTAFYYALRDTLVTSDLETASKIAYGAKRFRVVTLEGQLIDISGTMSGGGGQPQKGLMGSKIVEDHSKVQGELAKLERKMADLSDEFATIKTKRQQGEAEVHALNDKIAELEIAIPKMEMDVQSVTKRQKEIRAGLPVLEQQAENQAATTKRIEEIQKTMKVDEKELNKIKETTNKLEAAMKEIQDKIMDAGGITLQVAKGKVESTTQKVSIILFAYFSNSC